MNNSTHSKKRQKADSDKYAIRREKVADGKRKSKVKATIKNIVISNKYKQVDYKVGLKAEFYATDEWRKLRWKVLSASSGKCAVCGRSNSIHGVVLHVDHILPRSKFPNLELSEKNLQVLCEDCNLGKGAEIKL